MFEAAIIARSRECEAERAGLSPCTERHDGHARRLYLRVAHAAATALTSTNRALLSPVCSCLLSPVCCLQFVNGLKADEFPAEVQRVLLDVSNIRIQPPSSTVRAVGDKYDLLNWFCYPLEIKVNHINLDLIRARYEKFEKHYGSDKLRRGEESTWNALKKVCCSLKVYFFPSR